ncbi:MAG: BREX system P-loop protein BrxC [Nitrososphaeria archaeon]
MKPSMLVKDILEKDPARQIERVIKVDERDPRVVGSELEEYVVTDEIRQYLEDIIDRFIESRHRTPESVCAWISGFFGSGKSHFLKVLGYVLSNLNVILEDGHEVRAASYFCKKHSLPGGIILEKELRSKAIFVNMLNFPRDSPEAPSISKIVYTAFLEELGFSDVFWVAEIEKMLQERGLWESFLEYIEKETGKPWQQIRRITAMVGPLLAKALHDIDKKTYYKIEEAEKAIEDVKKSFELTPRKLVEALVAEAEKLGKENGRIILLLDEVGLYIGTNTDRLTDLGILAEHVERIGKGKVWLFVTAQEALEEVIPRVEAYRPELEKIKDRFQIRVTLTPENIDTVVKKRLLSKVPDPTKLKHLEDLYNKFSGSLATFAVIKNPAREYGGLLTRINKEKFMESYPLMPYHVLLMQHIFGSLRLRGKAIPELTGRERAILSVVRALLIGPKADVKGLAYAELGSLATFDAVYDAIHPEVRGEYQSIIEDATKLGEKEGLKIGSVAKALFLLQQIGEWIPCTIDNIAAVLYSYLGEDGVSLRNKVKICLEELQKNKWITEEDGKWRFLTNIERTFEQEVASKFASAVEKKELAVEVAKSIVNEFKTYNYGGIRVFDVHLFVDDKEITSKGQITLRFYSPLFASMERDLTKSLLAKSLAAKDTVFVVCDQEKRFEQLLEKVICIEKAIKDREAKPLTPDEENIISRYRKDIELLKNDELPKLFESACENGAVIINGKEIKLDGRKSLQEVIKKHLKDVIDDLFTQFQLAAFKVEKDEHIGSILTWQKGRLPSVYRELQLVDDKGNILLDRPVASRILQEIRRRHKEGEDCSGATLAEHFGSQPYGWDPKIVRLTLATLFKSGAIAVNLDGKDYVSATELGSHEAFTNARAFNRARFYPGIEITPEQRNKAWELMSSVLGLRAENTIEDIDKKLVSHLSEKLQQIVRLEATASALDLPILGRIEALQKTVEEIVKAPNTTRRILNFIDNSRIEILKSITLIDELVKFEEKGNLKEYKKITRFIRECAHRLVRLGEEEEVSLKILEESIKSQKFMELWPEIISKYERIKDKYEKLYLRWHEDRNELASRAIKSLHSHPAFKKLKEEDVERIIQPLKGIICTAKKVEFNENFVCSACKSTIEELSISVKGGIEIEEQRIKEEFAKKLIKIEPKAEEILGFKEEIRSQKDVDDVTHKLKKVCERALKEKKIVKVNVSVE